ncbi:flagellar basal-body rod protein FlgF [Aquabacter sp. CN5-332]|uniref:flagellar basal-body rod protein FlgF n=1 Tax=Aquabacter sp. CN5-332 TaxID=3156608 RepID=UPI0032B4CAFC
MASSIYVALSAQSTMERRLATIATNLSNMSTPGFRAEEVKFETLLSKMGRNSVAFANDGEVFTSLKSGPVTYTGNTLDVAVRGAAWLGLDTPAGRVLTRDGRLQINENGELKTLDGFAVVDPGGRPILLDPNGGTVSIGMDGAITQAGQPVGSIGVFEMSPNAKLVRYSNSGVIPDLPPNPVIDFTNQGVRQGYIEGSNVDPIMEMTKLIMVQRAFESAAMAVQAGEDLTQQAITSLGPA